MGVARGPVHSLSLAPRRNGPRRTFEGDCIPADAVEAVLRDLRDAVDKGGRDVDLFPNDRDAGFGIDILDGLRDLGTDACAYSSEQTVVRSRAVSRRTISGNERHDEVALYCCKHGTE